MITIFSTVIIYCISLLVKINILLKSLKNYSKHKAWLFLSISLGCLVINDISWIIWFIEGATPLSLFVIRTAWAFYCVFYVSLFFLIDSLSEKSFSFKRHHYILIAIALFFSVFFVYRAFAPVHTLDDAYLVINILFVLLLLFTIFNSLKSLRSTYLPKILKKQLSIILTFFFFPFIVVDFLLFFISIVYSFYLLSFFTSLSTALITTAMYFCFKKIFDLRFLNFKEHVQEAGNFDFIYDFKYLLAQLGNAMHQPEVVHATKSFFQKAFGIPYAKTIFIMRDLNNTNYEPGSEEKSHLETSVEHFLSHCKDMPDLEAFLYKLKIFIYDEISFSAFYEETNLRKTILNFLNTIQADVFLPIYDKKTIVAYLVIERDARGNELYTNVERDEMLVLASYLGNIVNLLQNKNLDTLIAKEHVVEAELYHKHQEINQYKESIRSFLHNSKERNIGLLFYKNRQFLYGNKAAQEFITINLNTQQGHPLSKAFRQIARQVESYKSQQSLMSKDLEGNRIVISGLPNLEQNNTIFMVYYPEVSDIIKEQLNLLRDPSERDYVLYLETTQSGQLINKFIPGHGPTISQFKIDLLKAALNKKATLLTMPDEDLPDMVEILHHISLRDKLHTIKLTAPTQNLDVAIKIFGINPLFNTNKTKPLLEQLNGVGTLFIQNIHFLDLETQQRIALFIKSGIYSALKSDQRSYSDVRILCSAHQNLQKLVEEGVLAESLYHELKTSISLPSLFALSEKEFTDLTNEYVEQATQTQTFKNFFELTEREKNLLTQQRPVSLRNLKERIQSLLVQKSKKKNIYHETHFNPAYNIADPELADAAKLGKHALRDQKIMSLLWDKFKNQNKIATFLGVNRSSVYRRCKDFNLV